MRRGIVLCIAGMPGCGKEEILKMASQAGFAVIRMGDVVREEASRRGISSTDEGIGRMAHRERKIHGPGIWAKRTLERISEERMVIDGIRSFDEIAVFRKSFDDQVLIVAIHASPETRYRRISSRRRRDDILNEEELQVRDRRELKWGLGEVIALAEYILVNEGSLEEFREKAKELLQEIFG
ncbi:MAG: AAA family ATPase [Thermoplasmata archaeon]